MKAMHLFVLLTFSIQGFSQRKLSGHTTVSSADYPKLVTRTLIITGDKNLLLQVPALERSVVSILLDGIETGVIHAYRADNDSLSLTPKDLTELLKVDTFLRSAALVPDSVTKLIIKEEWVFQRDKGRLVVRIKGIAPVIKVIDAVGITHEKPAFWVRYTDAREFFVTKKIKSDLQKEKLQNLSDVFDGRYFNSEIVSESQKL